MKICIVSDAYYPYPSGVSEYAFYVAKYLRKFGHDVKILTTHYPKTKGIEGKEFEEGVFRVGRVFLIPANKSYATPTIGWGVSRIVKEYVKREKFDLFHLHTPIFPGLSYFALHYSSVANVAVFHSTGFKVSKTGSGAFKKLFKKDLEKIQEKIAISPSAEKHTYPYFPGKYNIIPCGIDAEKFNTKVLPKKELSFNRPKILYFGRLDRRKGLPELLKAIPLIKKKIPDILLLVAGRGPLEKRCKKLAKELKILDSVVFNGFIPDEEVPSYYASCDIYCSPALGGESFGIVLIESMAVGTPVVASNIVGYDYVVKNGYNGLFFNPQKPESIANTILKVLKSKNLRDRLIKNGKEFVQDYSWEKIAKEMEKVYFKAIKKAKTNK